MIINIILTIFYTIIIIALINVILKEAKEIATTKLAELTPNPVFIVSCSFVTILFSITIFKVWT